MQTCCIFVTSLSWHTVHLRCFTPFSGRLMFGYKGHKLEKEDLLQLVWLFEFISVKYLSPFLFLRKSSAVCIVSGQKKQSNSQGHTACLAAVRFCFFFIWWWWIQTVLKTLQGSVWSHQISLWQNLQDITLWTAWQICFWSFWETLIFILMHVLPANLSCSVVNFFKFQTICRHAVFL